MRSSRDTSWRGAELPPTAPLSSSAPSAAGLSYATLIPGARVDEVTERGGGESGDVPPAGSVRTSVGVSSTKEIPDGQKELIILCFINY